MGIDLRHCERSEAIIKQLFSNLELAGLNYFSCWVNEMIHIEPAVKITEIDNGFLRSGSARHFLTQEAINLYRHSFFVTFLQIKRNKCCGRVGV